MLLDVYVPAPERWWIASKSDFGWLVDPDLDDNKVRYPDGPKPDWAVIVRAAEELGRQISNGIHDIQLEVPDDLSKHDQEIVRSWSRIPPMSDIWKVELVDGRHRLWAAWNCSPNALLPISSALLAFLDQVEEMPIIREIIREEASEGLKVLPPGVAARNRPYVQSLKRASTI